MNRRAFALSWGRKIFFGMGWALLSVVALTYLQSRILPESPLGWIFFVTSFVGQYGLIISGLYFLFYYPITWLFPAYYTSRFLSLILLNGAALVIAFDSYIFSQYHFHSNSFILDLLSSSGLDSFLGISISKYFLLLLIVLILSLVIWIRGDWIWRKMQTRFSNPVKNWYVVLIFFCLILSHGVYLFAEKNQLRKTTRLTEVFPLSSFLFDRGLLADSSGLRNFYYPIKEPSCKNSGEENILMIVVDQIKNDDLHIENTPFIEHLKTHGVTYKNHFSGGAQKESGILSMFYSLPEIYMDSIKLNNSSPVLLSKMAQSEYLSAVFSSGMIKGTMLQETAFSSIETHEPDQNSTSDKNIQTTEAWKKWLHSTAKDKKFFSAILLENIPEVIQPALEGSEDKPQEKSSLSKIDELIKSIVAELDSRKHLSKTMIVLTGASSGALSGNNILDKVKVPLIIIYPDRLEGVVQKSSSHYDIVPTLMSEVFECKKKYEEYSFGSPLRDPEGMKWLITSDHKSSNIIDFEKKVITKIPDSGKYEVMDLDSNQIPRGKVAESVVFEALKSLTRFYKKPRD